MAQIIRYIDPAATGAANGTSWTDAYTTFAQWEVAEQQDLTDGGGDYMTVYCRSSNQAADAGCIINGWTTGATNYIEIIGADFPANGKYDATKFRFAGENVNLVETYEDYLRFHNLQFVVTASGTGSARGLQCPSMGAANYILVDSCIFKGVCSGTGLGIGFQSGDTDVIADVVNCLAYDFFITGDTHFSGINVAGNVHIYNSTAYGCTRGFTGVAGTTIINCISGNNEDDFAGAIGTIDYCCSDDGDGGHPVAPAGGNWANEFTSIAGADFSLKLGGNCIGAGVDNPGAGLYSDDIIGTARSTTWDIGAFEYFVSGYILTAETGSYALTGTAVTLLKSSLVEAGAGSYVITGQDATLTKVAYGIDIGSAAIDRDYTLGTGLTVIDLANPANADGEITTVEIFAALTMSDAKVGTFYQTGEHTFKCRDSEVIGTVTGGSKQTFNGLTIAVATGDFIGIYYSAGTIELSTSGGVYVSLATGDWADPDDEKAYTGNYADYAISVYGIGVTSGYVLTAGAGNYAITGTAVSLLKSHLIVIGIGNYAITGTAVSLFKGNLLTIGVGNYILTGQAASFLKSSLITVDAGSYTLTGQVVTFLRSSLVEAGVGSYILTGTAVTLTKIGVGEDAHLLCHFDGADQSTAIVDSTGRHSLTCAADAQLDTAQKKWGTASLLLDGTGDYLTSDDHADWDICGSNSDNWTIDLWIKLAVHTGSERIISQSEDNDNLWQMWHEHGYGLRFAMRSGGVQAIDTLYGPEIIDTDWHHIALCKVGSKYAIYKDGVQGNYTDDADVDTFAAALRIGTDYGPNYFFNGWMDELRIDHSNLFSAAPNVGLTDTITVPTGPYWTVELAAEAGSCTIAGTAAGLFKSHIIVIGAGSYILTGQAAGLLKNSLVSIGSGSYAITGQDVTLTTVGIYVLVAEVGNYVITGTAVSLLKSHLIVIGIGNYVITGTAVSLFKGRSLTIEPGSYMLTGVAVSLLKSNLLSMGVGSYGLTGQAVTLTYSVGGYILTAGSGSYVVVGQVVTLQLFLSAIPPAMHRAFIDPYSGGAWLWLVEISIPGFATIYLARNTENVVYAGREYEKFNFDLGLSAQAGDGNIPRTMLSVVQDADYTLEDKINATQGGAGGTVKLIRAHEDFLNTSVVSLEQLFSILTSGSDAERVTFSCGIPDPLLKKIPLRRYSSKRCPYALPGLFHGPECGLAGTGGTCTGKFEDCFAKGNAARWGGSLGLDPNNTRV